MANGFFQLKALALESVTETSTSETQDKLKRSFKVTVDLQRSTDFAKFFFFAPDIAKIVI